ncbi:MAG: hypothetical protein OQK46_05260 [Gammaproteobacteria bacterium]|nr:hypothetical protein [Gammaproteobacteria bacterium]
MLNILKKHTKNYYVLLFSALVTAFLTACSPHPATGTWLASEVNTNNYSKIIVHFDPKLEIYSVQSNKPALYCGWSGANKNDIILECMSSENQKQMDIYQLNVTDESKAELVYEGEVIAKFIRSPES